MLNSTINVEFVYIILEGISQFSLLNNFKEGLTKDQMNRFRKMELQMEKNGDVTVKLDKFVVKDDDASEENEVGSS